MAACKRRGRKEQMLRRRRSVTWGNAHGGLSSVVLSSRWGGGDGDKAPGLWDGTPLWSSTSHSFNSLTVRFTYVARVPTVPGIQW